jgi:pilus assembly protein Flp/PilA
MVVWTAAPPYPGNYGAFEDSGLTSLQGWNPSSSRGPGSRANLEVNLTKLFSKFLSDESGATAIEYGLIAAGISLAIIAVVNGVGSNLNDKFTSINSSLK